MSDPDFDGVTYERDLDHTRLSSQLADVKRLMLADNDWHTLPWIVETLGYPEASVPAISARLRDLRKRKFGAYQVDSRRKAGADGLWEYRVLPPLDEMDEPQGRTQFQDEVPPPTAVMARRLRADLFEMVQRAKRAGFKHRYPKAAIRLGQYLEYLAGDLGRSCPKCDTRLSRTYDGLLCPRHGSVDEMDDGI
jgi:hypothetical protein